MRKAGFLYQPNLKEGIQDWIDFPYTFYDAFNPAAANSFGRNEHRAVQQGH